jgi:tRNA A37 N6-isopentenylltransferase MiaA
MADRLAEYLPAKTRLDLARACLGGYRAARAKSPKAHMSVDLDVGLSTLDNWLRFRTRISDANTEKLIALTLRVAPERAREILLMDLERHRRMLEALHV